MKTRYLLLSLLVPSLIVIAAPVFPYDDSQPPSLSLTKGYELAVQALGTATNQFHCISAKLTTHIRTPRWSFAFCTTNTPPSYKDVSVYFDGKAQVEEPRAE